MKLNVDCKLLMKGVKNGQNGKSKDKRSPLKESQDSGMKTERIHCSGPQIAGCIWHRWVAKCVFF